MSKTTVSNPKRAVISHEVVQKEVIDMENRYTVAELIAALEHAKRNNMPVYAGEGPCGGCDLVIGEPKKKDTDELLKKLKTINPNIPFYPSMQGPCGGCDVCILPK